jgi:hypothetical protein
LGRPFARWAASPCFRWPPVRLARMCREHESVGVVCPPLCRVSDERRPQVRCIGLDVYREFCEVAISEEGRVRSAGRIRTRRQELELFAQSLGSEDEVALDTTGRAARIAEILRPRRAGRGRQREEVAPDLRGQGQDRSARRAPAGRAFARIKGASASRAGARRAAVEWRADRASGWIMGAAVRRCGGRGEGRSRVCSQRGLDPGHRSASSEAD